MRGVWVGVLRDWVLMVVWVFMDCGGVERVWF